MLHSIKCYKTNMIYIAMLYSNRFMLYIIQFITCYIA